MAEKMRSFKFIKETKEVEIEVTCPFCRKHTEKFTMPYSEFAAWQAGELIQDACKSLNATQREALITGMCDNCFPSDEE